MTLLASSGDTALEVMLTASIVVPLMILAVVCWVFWKAAKREDARQDKEGGNRHRGLPDEPR